MNIKLLSQAAFLLFVFICPTLAQTAEIRKIDAYVRGLDSFVKANRTMIVIADTADYDKEKPEWKRFASEAELDKFRENSETYTIAHNFQKGGKLVASNFTKFSPSGDWSKYLFHYFREDGSLAKVRSELRTFYGDFIVIENLYFDRSGKQLRKTVRYLDLFTRKPQKPAKDYLDGLASPSREPDFYKHSSKLPFIALISTSTGN